MMTIASLREAWTFALSEIDIAIRHLEAEGASTTGDYDPGHAANMWLSNLRRSRREYDALLSEHPSVH